MEADGDFEAAVEVLRVKGAARASPSAAPSATAEQRPRRGTPSGALIELAARPTSSPRTTSSRRSPTQVVAQAAATRPPTPRRSRRPLDDGQTVAEAIAELPAVLGEKIELAPRRRASTARSPSTSTSAQPTCPRRSACWSRTTGPSRTPPAAPRMQIAAHAPAASSPATRSRPRSSRTSVAIAEETRDEEGKPEAALPQDHRGPRQRLLQGERAPRAGVRAGQRRRPSAGRARRGRRHADALRALRGRRLTQPDRVRLLTDQPDVASRRPSRATRRAHSGPRASGAAASVQPRSTRQLRRARRPLTARFARVLLKLSGEAFAGGEPRRRPRRRAAPSRARSPPRSARASQVADRRRRRQLLPRRRALAARAWTGRAPTTWACSARS